MRCVVLYLLVSFVVRAKVVSLALICSKYIACILYQITRKHNIHFYCYVSNKQIYGLLKTQCVIFCFHKVKCGTPQTLYPAK